MCLFSFVEARFKEELLRSLSAAVENRFDLALVVRILVLARPQSLIQQRIEDVVGLYGGRPGLAESPDQINPVQICCRTNSDSSVIRRT
jgi:hypothetical protein